MLGSNTCLSPFIRKLPIGSCTCYMIFSIGLEPRTNIQSNKKPTHLLTCSRDVDPIEFLKPPGLLISTPAGKPVAVNFHQLETPKTSHFRCLKKMVRIPRVSRAPFPKRESLKWYISTTPEPTTNQKNQPNLSFRGRSHTRVHAIALMRRTPVENSRGCSGRHVLGVLGGKG